MSNRFASFDRYGLRHLLDHLLPSKRWQTIEEVLTDLDFIEANCIAGMVHDLLQDCERVIQIYPDLRSVAQMREALVLELSSLVSRPEFAVQSVYNRLIWFDDLEPALYEQLEATRLKLNQLPFWIRAAALLPTPTPSSDLNISFEFSTSIQSLAPDSSAIAITSIKGEARVYSLKTGAILEKRKLDSKSIAAVAFCENPRRLAWMDVNGCIHSDQVLTTLAGRSSEERLLYHPQGGIVGAREDHALVAWQPEQDKVTILLENLPAPLVVLRFSSDEDYILCIAGNNPTSIGIINWNGEEWKKKNIPFTGAPIADLDYDPKTQKFAISQKNRCISVMDASGKVGTQIFYEVESQGQIIGAPIRCAIGKGDQSDRVFFCTRYGRIAVWDWQNGELETYADCFSKFNQQSFRFLITMPKSDKVFYSTDFMGGTISQQTQNSISNFHQSEVLACVITPSNHIVSAGKQDNRLKWFTVEKLTLLNERTVKDISVISSCEEGEQVLVGDHHGRIWIQFPDRDVEIHKMKHIFEGSVKDAFSNSLKTAFIAEEKGRVVFVDFPDFIGAKVYRHQSGAGKLTKILPAKANGLFWSLSNEVEGVEGSSLDYVNLELIKEEGKEILYHSRVLLRDFNVSHDGNAICLVIYSMDGGVEVQILLKEEAGWKISGQRKYKKEIDRVIFLNQPHQLIAVIHNDVQWLEIWETFGNLDTLAEAALPKRVTCLAASGGYIVMGCQSGQLISYHLEWRK